MRLPDAAQLRPLLKLTKAREQAAMAELGKVAARRKAAADHVAELRDVRQEARTPEEHSVLAKWHRWQKAELAKRQQHLARCSAEYVTTARRCGRVIAEHVVVESLSDQAEHRAKSQAEAQRLEALNQLSHLLAHDVGDQDI